MLNQFIKVSADNFIYEVEMLADDDAPEVLDTTAIEVNQFHGAVPPATSERGEDFAAVSKNALNQRPHDFLKPHRGEPTLEASQEAE